jgi:hypothetical protein
VTSCLMVHPLISIGCQRHAEPVAYRVGTGALLGNRGCPYLRVTSPRLGSYTHLQPLLLTHKQVAQQVGAQHAM